MEETIEREKIILERILTLKQFIKEQADPQDYHELGICYFHLSNHEQAISYFDELIEKYPDYIEIAAVYALQIYLKLQLHQYDQSLLLLDKRLDIFPDDTRLLGMKAHCLYQQGQLDDAILIHARILEIEPENINSLNSMGYMLVLKKDPNLYQKAFGFLKKALKLKPDNPAYLDSLGYLLLNQGNLTSAKIAFERALARMPENAQILDHLGELVKQSGKQNP